ncbi:serine/arginine repetitive matrix protein 1-like [Podarcis raffonei]|uniref:serine/arginine repetitive matrix protein 1-like n=1 Tax=Podarcis raffonei TaxID=65483 RepID=UPI00232912CB|nr:serine/arginine repetitive matrix protein 1-like [Podarcis raffonei]
MANHLLHDMGVTGWFITPWSPYEVGDDDDKVQNWKWAATTFPLLPRPRRCNKQQPLLQPGNLQRTSPGILTSASQLPHPRPAACLSRRGLRKKPANHRRPCRCRAPAPLDRPLTYGTRASSPPPPTQPPRIAGRWEPRGLSPPPRRSRLGPVLSDPPPARHRALRLPSPFPPDSSPDGTGRCAQLEEEEEKRQRGQQQQPPPPEEVGSSAAVSICTYGQGREREARVEDRIAPKSLGPSAPPEGFRRLPP